MTLRLTAGAGARRFRLLWRGTRVPDADLENCDIARRRLGAWRHRRQLRTRSHFGTDWKAEAEHGGYYQAIATGIYRQHGLDVTLRQGGPQVNHAQLLAAGRLDFNLAPNSFIPLNFVQENIPMVAVAAIFQKDPSVLIAHPGQGNDSLAALKGKPIMIGSDTRIGQLVSSRANSATPTTRSGPTPSASRRSSPTPKRSSRAICRASRSRSKRKG